MTTINDDFKIAVGQRLKALRKRKKLTLFELADKMCNEYHTTIDEKSIRRYESGENLPKIDNLICLAEILDSSLDYIIYGKNSTDDDSVLWYDHFKRLNRLVYSLTTDFVEDSATGRKYLELWEPQTKLYWDRITNFASTKNYNTTHRGKNPLFSAEELDDLFVDFSESKESTPLSKERTIAFFENQIKRSEELENSKQ